MLGRLTEFVATAQGKVIALLVIIVLFGGWSLGIYLQGRSDGKQACINGIQKVATAVANRRADNAADATERYRVYNLKDRELEVGISDALELIHDYYADGQPPRTIEKTKLVQVPGSKEYVYVPTDACPNDFLSDDELRLFNLGNSRDDFNPDNSK